MDNMPISLVPAQLLIKGELVLNGDVILNRGANLVVWPRATMTLGKDVMICSGVLLKAVNRVSIGNHVMISSGCFIMDSSIHALYNTETFEVARIDGEMTIGDNVWLNMHTSVIKWGGGAKWLCNSAICLYRQTVWAGRCVQSSCRTAG